MSWIVVYPHTSSIFICKLYWIDENNCKHFHYYVIMRSEWKADKISQIKEKSNEYFDMKVDIYRKLDTNNEG